MNTSEAVITGAGQLPCRHVIHVAEPMWPMNEESLLYDAIMNILKQAECLKCKSLALPVISAGVYGFPTDLCATTIVGAVYDFVTKNPSDLHEIRFTNITVEHSVAFHKAMTEICGKDVVEGKPYSTTGSVIYFHRLILRE